MYPYRLNLFDCIATAKIQKNIDFCKRIAKNIRKFANMKKKSYLCTL